MDIVVACDEKGVIAYQNKLPWHLPEDLAFFKEMTLDKVVIMGHKTYDIMPKKLFENRVPIVFSRKETGDIFVDSLEQCLEKLKDYSEKGACVIGGQDIFNVFLDVKLIDTVYLTLVKGSFSGDRFFPLEKIQSFEKKLIKETDQFSIYCLTKPKL